MLRDGSDDLPFLQRLIKALIGSLFYGQLHRNTPGIGNEVREGRNIP